MPITAEQYRVLMTPIRASRVSSRRQGGKDLHYVEAWEIKAHLTRIFGFGNWDSEIVDYHHIGDRAYTKDGKDMVEVIYNCRVQLTIRDANGDFLCRHSEAAAGSTSWQMSTLGEHHDNALKSAESDALKRCAINLGSQFGLSLYKGGSLEEVIKQTVVTPDGVSTVETPSDPEAEAQVIASLGATPVE
jgi:recombination DNA repair RAD52 pathway protein